MSVKSLVSYVLYLFIITGLFFFIPKISSAQTIDATFPTTNGYVHTMYQDGNDLYIGGTFTTVGGVSRNRIAKIDVTTKTVDATFNPNAGDQVFSITMSGSDLYVGGNFTTIGGETRNRIAKLNTTDGSADATFNPNANGNVRDIFIDGSDLYAGGFFTTIGGQTRNRIAKLNLTNGNADSTFNPNANNSVRRIRLGDEGLHVSGNFTTIGGGSRDYFALLDTTAGSLIDGFNALLDGVARDWLYHKDSLLIVGGFTEVYGSSSNDSIAKVSQRSGKLDTSLTFSPEADNYIASAVFAQGDMYISGWLSEIDGETVGQLTRIDPDAATVDTSFTVDANDDIISVLHYDSSNNYLYVGGQFTQLDSDTSYVGLARYALAADTTDPVITTGYTPTITTDSTPLLWGQVNDDNALTSIEYQVDSTAGSWSSCTSSDGTIDSKLEGYQCTPTLTSGAHTVYIRATDSDSNTSAASSHSVTLVSDTSDVNYNYSWKFGDRTILRTYPDTISSDTSGNTLVAVHHRAVSDDLHPLNAGEFFTSGGIQADVALFKLDSNGIPLWSKKMFSEGALDIRSIKTDSDGNIYLGGDFTLAVDLDPSSGTDYHTSITNREDAFIAKYNSDGEFQWSRIVKSSSSTSDEEFIYDLYIDDTVIYAVGEFEGTVDFDDDSGTDNRTATATAGFLLSYNTDGTYNWVRELDGDTETSGRAVAVSSDDKIYVTGNYSGTTDFDDLGTDNSTSAGSRDTFITQYDSDGTYGFTYSIGGTGDEENTDIEIDSSDSIYVSGYFEDTVDFDPTAGTDEATSITSDDGYILKLTDPTTYGWVGIFTSTNRIQPHSIDISAAGNLIIFGYYYQTADIDPTSNTDEKISEGGSDIFLTSISTDKEYNWGYSLGGSDQETGFEMHIDTNNNILFGSRISSTNVDFDFGSGEHLLSGNSSGNSKAILTSITHDNEAAPTPTPIPPTATPIPGVATDPSEKREVQIAVGNNGNNEGKVLSPTGDSNTGGQKVAVVIEKDTLSFDSFLSSKRKTSEDMSSLASLYSTNISNCSASIAPGSNAFMVGGCNGVLGIRLPTRIAWQVGSVQSIYYKALPPEGSDKQGAKVIPELLSKESIVSLSYTDGNLIPAGEYTKVFKPESLKLARSRHGVYWEILDTSVVDEENRTVSALDKIYGYYMIVSPTNGNVVPPSSVGVVFGTNDNTIIKNRLSKDDGIEKPALNPSSFSENDPEPQKNKPSFFWRLGNFIRNLFR